MTLREQLTNSTEVETDALQIAKGETIAVGELDGNRGNLVGVSGKLRGLLTDDRMLNGLSRVVA